MVSISSQKGLNFFFSINKTSEKIDNYLKYKLIEINDRYNINTCEFSKCIDKK